MAFKISYLGSDTAIDDKYNYAKVDFDFGMEESKLPGGQLIFTVRVSLPFIELQNNDITNFYVISSFGNLFYDDEESKKEWIAMLSKPLSGMQRQMEFKTEKLPDELKWFPEIGKDQVHLAFKQKEVTRTVKIPKKYENWINVLENKIEQEISFSLGQRFLINRRYSPSKIFNLIPSSDLKSAYDFLYNALLNVVKKETT